MTDSSQVRVQITPGGTPSTAVHQGEGIFCCRPRETEPEMAAPDEDFHCEKIIRLPHGYTAYRLIEPSRPVVSPIPVVVMLHGIYGSGYMWADLAELMAEFEQGPRARVLIFDYYGRGRSPWTGLPMSLDMYVTQLKELLDALKLSKQPVALIGYDLGGAIATGFAAKFPQLCLSLSLMGTAGVRFNSPFDETKLQRKYFGEFHISRKRVTLPDYQLTEFFRHGMEEPHSNLINKQVNMVKWQLRYSPGFLGALLSTFRHFPLRYMDQLFAAVGKHSRRVLVMYGSKDSITPYRTCMQVLEECFPNADIVDVLDAGHNILFEKFDETTTELLSFHKEIFSSFTERS